MKRLFWIGSSHEDLKQFPDEVQDEMGHGLYLAQMGGITMRKPLAVWEMPR